MRFPFVSRAAFDLLKEQRDAADARAAALEARYWKVLEQMEQRLAPVTMPERKKDELSDVIALRAGADPALKRHLHQWAKQQRRDGADETAILNSVLHWQADDEGVPA